MFNCLVCPKGRKFKWEVEFQTALLGELFSVAPVRKPNSGTPGKQRLGGGRKAGLRRKWRKLDAGVGQSVRG